MARKRNPEASESETEANGATNGHDQAMPATKTRAVQMAIEAGYDMPEEGADYLLSRFGMEMTPAHFSSTKSRLKKMEGKPPARRGRRPKSIEGIFVPPKVRPASNGEGELLAALEALKPLVKSMGADRVKRLVELIG